MSFPVINKLVVIGIGLIGGSLATGLKKRGACREVIGIARTKAVCAKAEQLGIVDRAYTSLKSVANELTDGDVIFIAVPTLAVRLVLAEIKKYISPDVTITDGASVKGSVQDAAIEVYGYVPSQFVLGHPIAGSEKSGVTAANPNLYRNHRCILTPLPTTSRKHLKLVKSMWQVVGAEVLTMSVEKHDRILGATSHLPHVIAYSLVDTLTHDVNSSNILRYAAGGFRDFTRIASSDPVMWHDIMRANKDDVVHALDMFIDNLSRLRSSIKNEDSENMLHVFKRAKIKRDKFVSTLDRNAALRNANTDSAKKVSALKSPTVKPVVAAKKAPVLKAPTVKTVVAAKKAPVLKAPAVKTVLAAKKPPALKVPTVKTVVAAKKSTVLKAPVVKAVVVAKKAPTLKASVAKTSTAKKHK